ncbi:hypothetical protein Cni_G15776 [Canna indica]|uniref:Agenet domain-containing protein n=1 Tax=Canna indica TaxID=4628 RepID=A0AAQ3KGP1_9LILI|nr:hypothetical protein Cni_G15776 [Canna indica]
MDYEDNDFQSQNFQLIGEYNDGFPQSLELYASPKFDIDDHFQAQLRFDSLSETGLLLGSQGEENKWIEEFSLRNTATEFGSSVSQTCSISGHGNIWSTPPSSESPKVLVKSVGEDEMVRSQVMNTIDGSSAKDNSDNCGSESYLKTDSTLLTHIFPNSILGSNEDEVGDQQHAVTSQSSSDKKSEIVLDVSLVDEKLHSSEKVVALHNKEAASSSSDVSKESLVVGELLEVIKTNEPLDNLYERNSSLDHQGRAITRSTEACPNFISCSTQDGPLSLLTDNAGIATSKLDNPSFSEQKVEECHDADMSKQSGALSSENKNEITCCLMNDQNFNSNVGDLKISSHLVSSSNSLTLPNERSSNCVFLRNSDEDVGYQVKVLNEDMTTGEICSFRTKEVPSIAMERDENTGKNSFEVGTENFPELFDIAEPLDLSHDVHAHVLKDDHLPLAQGKKITSLEGVLATSKAVVEDNCSELSSSVIAVKVEFATPLETERNKKELYDSHIDCRIDPLKSKNSELVQRKKSTKDESSKGIVETSTANLDASGLAIHNGPSAALLDGAENKLSSSVHDKLAPKSDTIPLLAELKEDNLSHLEEKECSAKLINISGMKSKNCNTVENPEVSLFDAQNTSVVEPDKKSIMDQAGVNSPFPVNSTVPQILHPEEVHLQQKEVVVSSIPDSYVKKDVGISSLSAIKSNTKTGISGQPQEVLDLDVDGPSIKNVLDGLEMNNNDTVHITTLARVSSLRTLQSTEGKDANLAPANNCDKLCLSVTKTDALSIERSNLPPTASPENHDKSSDAEGGNLSSVQGHCGSPSFISSKEHTLDKIACGESNHSSVPVPAYPVSDSRENSVNFTSSVKDFKVSTTSEGDMNFKCIVQPVTDLSQIDTKEGSPFCNLQSSKQLQSSERCLDDKKTTDAQDKGKKVSSRATRKRNILKGDAKKSQEKSGKVSKKNQCTSPVLASIRRDKNHVEGIHQCTYAETNTTKCSPSIQTSKMLESNNSVPSAFFKQPFTDIQQVQLRAQIFVYGSLIQAVLPDEACMVAAFGGTDGGRSSWERAWRAASERLHYQQSCPNSCGTHLHCYSGISCSHLQSKTLSSPVVWRDTKYLNTATQGSVVSSQSPFHSSFNGCLSSSITRGTHLELKQSLSPLYSYQNSQIKQGLGSASPFLSQGSPFASNGQHSAVPIAETAQLTPIRESSVASASSMQLASPVALLPNQGANNVSAALFVPVEAQNKAPTLAISKNASVSEKSRKRKKSSAVENFVPTLSISQPPTESAAVALNTNHVPNSVGLSSSSTSSTVTCSGLALTTSHPITFPCYQVSSGDNQQRVLFSKDIFSQIEHSKLQAENASAYAASALRHSQFTWKQMSDQRESDLASEDKQNLAFAAVAAAAAASVAKVAAEAAKIASEAALQVMLMADEALNTANTGRSTQISEISLESGKNLLTSTLVSIAKDKDKIHGTGSIMPSACETSTNRVEIASAAIKRTENMDALLKVVEMAAEAVSQAGSVVAMGDPIPFSINELIEAGARGHWKLCHATMGNGTEINDVQARENMGLNVAADHEIIAKRTQRVSHVYEMSLNNKKTMLAEDQYGGSELENGSKAIPTDIPVKDPTQGNIIQKGSRVEVAVDEEGLRGAWFSAWVLDVKDDKAQVCYKDLASDKGPDKLNEWIPLNYGSDEPPRIRVAHPVIVAKYERTRKRRREALGNYTWAIGDRVDAWIHDGWWEGIVTGKSQDDESKFTIHFPAGGGSSTVAACDLRYSLIWKKGQWIEWSQDKERVTVEPHEGDTPHVKRQKVGQLDAKNKWKIDDGDTGTLSRNNCTDASLKLDEWRPVNLTEKDIVFSMGEKDNTNTLKVRRAGLQKNGSEMVFGLPRPGKTRKFMDVSKHYAIDKTDNRTERSGSVQFVKKLMPQASKLNNISKVDVRGRRANNLNSRGPKSLRSQNPWVRSTVNKEKLSETNMSVSDGRESSLRTAFGNEEKSSMEADSSLHMLGTIDTPVLVSSLQSVTGVPSVNKKPFSIQAEKGKKGKLLSAVGKSKRSEIEASQNPGKGIVDVSEPRRSNRRFQPTSRLLEGLQSALIMSKKP